METAFNRFESTIILSLGYLATTCLRRKAWTICKLKDLQNVISDKWHDVASDVCNQKSRMAVGKTSSSSGKEEWRTYSAFFLLISYWWFRLLRRFGIACIQAAMQMMNRLQKLLMRVIPKVSGLDILNNNIFHNLYISETYILYEF